MRRVLSLVLLLPFLFVPSVSAQYLGLTHRTVITPPAPTCSLVLPAVDSFHGTGAVASPCWTQTTAPGFVPLVRNTSKLVPNASGQQGMILYTGLTFAAKQYVQGRLFWDSNSFSGLCLEMTVGGDGACYFPSINSFYGIVAGQGAGGIVQSCADFPSGDLVRIETGITGDDVTTVRDVTTGTVLCTGVASNFAPGVPGVLIDHRTSSTDYVTDFEAGNQ